MSKISNKYKPSIKYFYKIPDQFLNKLNKNNSQLKAYHIYNPDCIL